MFKGVLADLPTRNPRCAWPNGVPPEQTFICFRGDRFSLSARRGASSTNSHKSVIVWRQVLVSIHFWGLRWEENSGYFKAELIVFNNELWDTSEEHLSWWHLKSTTWLLKNAEVNRRYYLLIMQGLPTVGMNAQAVHPTATTVFLS
jgi:hypothetical protein